MFAQLAPKLIIGLIFTISIVSPLYGSPYTVNKHGTNIIKSKHPNFKHAKQAAKADDEIIVNALNLSDRIPIARSILISWDNLQKLESNNGLFDLYDNTISPSTLVIKNVNIIIDWQIYINNIETIIINGNIHVSKAEQETRIQYKKKR